MASALLDELHLWNQVESADMAKCSVPARVRAAAYDVYMVTPHAIAYVTHAFTQI